MPSSYEILFFVASDLNFHHQKHPHLSSFRFGPTASFHLELLVIALHSNSVACWIPSDLGAHLSVSYLFALLYCSWDSHGKNTRMGCHILLRWTMICQNSSLWPIHPGWPCMAWLIASLSYASTFTMTRLWSMKGARSMALEMSICSSNETTLVQYLKLKSPPGQANENPLSFSKTICFLHGPNRPL